MKYIFVDFKNQRILANIMGSAVMHKRKALYNSSEEQSSNTVHVGIEFDSESLVQN